uniref:Uncharacterized protein n=1 Tax=Chromera velia CCMP2878 TaxID=1169474 RepID=A0A0G4H9C9_9ALVE|mmetsp:Transcript_17200/g.34872  ORF Transcript_17200/g.34872 Transcript_17200/m.34872 type:complete len:698 (-) Transcript_17200:607-2700(-)|eukprot:Cvel_5915.t1-p1 / transcript=Cvel_5915.t1 / gene=Cvel_5915 / organism=Chromera_velia_CCMP2878 / gene_product=hypothetical protein / transcript_product=hypothetical protein / location=Cvel_scaffold283:5865-11779(+) / protein_length=697 / sequence_SO=supercontig / SO=protein_coding / is_pseudo=false
MKFLVPLFALCAAFVLGEEPEEPKVNRPVSKVIKLLKDMKTALAQEQEEDEGIYKKFDCYCKKNKKDKEEGIATAEARVKDIMAFIDQAAATIERLEAEIKTLEAEIAANNQSLQEAAAIRETELEEFRKLEAEITEATTALKGAITVLSKHHTPSKAALLDIATVVNHVMYRLGGSQKLPEDQQDAVRSFLATAKSGETGPGYLGSSATFRGAYAPQSGVIFGILNNMKENFEKDLAEAQEEEAKKKEEYEALKKAKNEEIAADTAAKTEKEAQLGETRENLANSKEDIADTRAALAADQKLLQDLVLKCSETDGEWEERQKKRATEIAAVTKAISVLATDDAHDLFTRTFNPAPSLLQTSTRRKVVNYQRDHTSAILAKAAKKANGPHFAQLLQLSTQIKGGLKPFPKLIEKIDKMIDGLQKEKADEIKHRDWCIQMIHDNEKETMEAKQEEKDLQAKVSTLKETISTLEGEISILKGEIEKAQVNIQKLSEDREAENDEFKVTVRDAQATQKLLVQAIEVLNAYYQPEAEALLQSGTAVPVATYEGAYESSGLPPAPPGFETYHNNESGHGVIAMIDGIITESETLEKQAIKDEQAAQVAYEEMVKDLNGEITAKSSDVTDKSAEKSQAEQDLTAAKEDLSSNADTLAGLAKYAADVHASCDFTIKNFDVRQGAMDQEMAALEQAKAILKGMQS